MLKIKMLYGGYEDADNPLDYYLAPVSFPMEEERVTDTGSEKVVIENEEQLAVWAEERFAGFYEIWDMEFSYDCFVREVRNDD